MSTTKNQPRKSTSNFDVEHRSEESKFVIVESGRTSSLDYRREGNKIRLTHTFVPPENRGQGIAEALTREALQFAQDEKLQVVPDCGYVRSFIEKHDEFQHLVEDQPHHSGQHDHDHSEHGERTWWQTYKPLLLILAYVVGGVLIVASVTNQWTAMPMMMTFMGLFFVAFSFFKMLDLNGFADAYSGYDLIAGRWYGYGFIYPFIELGLGVMFLVGAWPVFTSSATLAVMTISTIGVVNSVIRGRDIQCGCLGTMFDLPMSTVTIVEDVTMVLMAIGMLTMLCQ